MNQPSHTKANNKKKRDTIKFPSTLNLLVMTFSIVLAFVVLYWLFYPKPYRIPCGGYYRAAAENLQGNVSLYFDPSYPLPDIFLRSVEVPTLEEYIEWVLGLEIQSRNLKLNNGITTNDLRVKVIMNDYIDTNNRSDVDVIIYSSKAKCGSRGRAFVHYGTGKREWLNEFGGGHEND
ncbi:MAG: hypothetical protein AMJ53_01135 [Gammaproteobacteria bacterium SG8_11]|nr:MAG: hypothetical protein AMJ53_01135 [Gammaproteobacteria bacterium SG8_11]